ncbi:unnamed protein product [Pleuronectes platessa]|uniref:Uncharacterized protein n=1 Tax=Pleuronectes platessa TaxID=8262 RepID=A0A9N7TPY0_PLEPL|nr:unnamed protein product [Pleuronectes platessa]
MQVVQCESSPGPAVLTQRNIQGPLQLVIRSDQRRSSPDQFSRSVSEYHIQRWETGDSFRLCWKRSTPTPLSSGRSG